MIWLYTKDTMSEKFANSYEGYTGKLLEEEIFGRWGGPWDGETFLKFRDSVEYAKNNQPPGWRPLDPAPRFAGDLFAIVAEKLGLEVVADGIVTRMNRRIAHAA